MISDWSLLPTADIRRIVATLCKDQFWPFLNFEEFCLQLKISTESKISKNFYAECSHVHFMYIMKFGGQWELSWDVFEHDCELYPIKLVTVDKNSSEHKFFPSLLAELELFKSSSEAKKNGWNKPLEIGDHFFKKKTYILRII